VNLWVVIPVKPFDLGKSRLSPVLSDQRRIALNQYLFANTLRQVRNLGAGSIVVSSSTVALDQASKVGAIPIDEPAGSGLNQAASIGTAAAKRLGATDVLIVPTDLPCANTSDFARFVSISDAAASVSIATDYTGEGTNALHLRLRRGFTFCFGNRSAQRHIHECVGAGVTWFSASSGPLAFDLDTPSDLSRPCHRPLRGLFAPHAGLLTQIG
jgi:2-phospho-L-lactate guanylyltransferase